MTFGRAAASVTKSASLSDKVGDFVVQSRRDCQPFSHRKVWGESIAEKWRLLSLGNKKSFGRKKRGFACRVLIYFRIFANRRNFKK